MEASIFPRFLPAGDSSILVELGERIDPRINRMAHALAEALRGADGLGESVPGYASLLVYYDPFLLGYDETLERIRRGLEQIDPEDLPAARFVEIPVSYGGAEGPDLEFVARHCGLSPAEVIARHSQVEYSVYFLGFLPGFPYLGGLDPAIAVPRLETPRTRIPAGSVGIAAEQTGVYPLESPGGWRIIGRTQVRLFDEQRDPPAVLRPGDHVRFVPQHED